MSLSPDGRRQTAPGPVLSLLTPDNCELLLIDYQPQMAFATHSIDSQLLVNNAVALAKTAKVFGVPTILTTADQDTFSGPTFAQLREAVGPAEPIDRTTMNAWEDERFRAAVERTGRRKLLLGGLWTEVCIVMPALQAIEAGYEVYVVADACGGTSVMAHEMAMQRMIQAGTVPVTWMQVLLELQRDWTRATAGAVSRVIVEHGGAFGLGMQFGQAVGWTGPKA
jgi:nicotinamidase-related amidase